MTQKEQLEWLLENHRRVTSYALGWFFRSNFPQIDADEYGCGMMDSRYCIKISVKIAEFIIPQICVRFKEIRDLLAEMISPDILDCINECADL